MTDSRWSWTVVALAGALVFGACGDSDDCTDGEAGCACLEGSACNGDLTCDMGTCVGTTDVGLSISDANARACDVLLTEGDDRVSTVSYGDGVKGTFVREAPRVALSFIAAADTAIPGGNVQLKIVGSGTDVAVDKVECANSDGSPLDNVNVAFAN